MPLFNARLRKHCPSSKPDPRRRHAWSALEPKGRENLAFRPIAARNPRKQTHPSPGSGSPRHGAAREPCGAREGGTDCGTPHARPGTMLPCSQGGKRERGFLGGEALRRSKPAERVAPVLCPREGDGPAAAPTPPPCPAAPSPGLGAPARARRATSRAAMRAARSSARLALLGCGGPAQTGKAAAALRPAGP